MDIITAKEHLHREGYCEFQLKDFDENAYNLLLSLKFKQGDYEYLENFKNIRFDCIGDDLDETHRINKLYESYEAVNEIKNLFLKKYDIERIHQIWLNSFYQPPNINDVSIIYQNILKHFYSNKIEDVFFGFQWTCYSEGCFLKDHNDGQGIEYQNICAILIYLNEEWNEEWGGNLILRNTKNAYDNDKQIKYKVVPEFGKVAIIDLAVFDTAHAVDTIIGDHNRCTLLAFVTDRELKNKK